MRIHFLFRTIFPGLLMLKSLQLLSQVHVREEPRHHPVFQNQYARILDVVIPPGDTSLFHIHATPSLFLVFNSRDVTSQVKGKGWIQDHSVAGKSWYRSFINDTLIHRVSNQDSLPFHVTDIELLQAFENDKKSQRKNLPFPFLYENEKAIAYSILKQQDNIEIPADHRPMIAELVEGNKAIFINKETGQSYEIAEGHFFYLGPGEPYTFSVQGKGEINMVIFEIK
jgi:hypothetical protein